MLSVDATVLANSCLTGPLWRIELEAGEIPEMVAPGQFVHLRLNGHDEMALRRPFSVYRVLPGEDCYDRLALIYQVTGRGTAALSRYQPGARLGLLGPLGQGFRQPVYAQRVLLVGGGLGWAALALAAGSFITFGVETHILVGARNADWLAALAPGVDARPYPLDEYGTPEQDGQAFIHLATDDGSAGHHGMNTELLAGLLDSMEFDYIATCGPEAMQRKVAEEAIARGIRCEVSLERRMACGLGGCLSCTVQTTEGNRRACCDGPVFDAKEVIW